MEEASLSFDKRKHPRIKVTIPVQFKVINETDEAMMALEEKRSLLKGDSKDVSAEGLFLVCDRILEKGDILKIEVVLPEESKPVRAFSEVIWVSDHGLSEGKHGAGIYFMALRDEDADAIGRFIAHILKNP
ncbi:MAG: PilZ domain-containing protein [candidate division FCPU426 bacterium]